MADQLVSYTVTGSEADLTALVIPVSPPQIDASYYVNATQASQDNGFYVMSVPEASQLAASFVLMLSTSATAGDVFQFTLVR